MGDLKSAWNIYKDIESGRPGKQVGVGISVIDRACSAKADLRAIKYRCGILQLLERLPGDLLTPWKESGQFADAVFQRRRKNTDELDRYWNHPIQLTF